MAITELKPYVVDSITGEIFAALVGCGMVLDATECKSNPRESVNKVLTENITRLMESHRPEPKLKVLP